MSFCLSVCLSIDLSIYLFVYLSISVSLELSFYARSRLSCQTRTHTNINTHANTQNDSLSLHVCLYISLCDRFKCFWKARCRWSTILLTRPMFIVLSVLSRCYCYCFVDTAERSLALSVPRIRELRYQVWCSSRHRCSVSCLNMPVALAV